MPKPMIALSTSWVSKVCRDADSIVGAITDAGFDTLELSFDLTGKTVDGILALAKKGAVNVVSLHNMCPLPAGVAPEKASPDYFSLSSTDEDERMKAVEVTRETIRYAHDFRAKAVILHAGRVNVPDRTRELAGSAVNRDHFEKIKREMIESRRRAERPFFEKAIKSLEELIPCARQYSVALGIENRYYYREIPSFDELKAIFSRFAPGELFYWHDTGHAEVFDRLGIVAHEDLLKHLADRLLGVHLHDIMKILDDHKAPLTGTFEFKKLLPFVGKDTIKVLEPHQPATVQEITRGRDYLEKLFVRER